MVEATEELSEDDRRALRGSKFAPLPRPPPPPKSRMAHPSGPITTNKAAALAKFLERKLKEPDGLKSLNPDLVELAVKNAKNTVIASKGSSSSSSGIAVRHVVSFGDSIEDSSTDEDKEEKKRKKRRKKMKKAKQSSKSDKKSKHKKLKS